jgi:hypothetical protein
VGGNWPGWWPQFPRRMCRDPGARDNAHVYVDGDNRACVDSDRPGDRALVACSARLLSAALATIKGATAAWPDILLEPATRTFIDLRNESNVNSPGDQQQGNIQAPS